MIDPLSLFVFASALVVVTVSPGPNVTALVARVLTRGHQEVWPFLGAMWIGEAAWLSVAVFGLGAVAASFAMVMAAIKYLGAAYLLYLAWQMWTTTRIDDADAAPRRGSPTHLFLTGLAITLGNPKIVVFYLSLLPSLVDMGRITIVGWLELLLVMLATLAACDLLWVVAATQARAWLRRPRFVRLVNRSCAACMAGAAASIAAR